MVDGNTVMFTAKLRTSHGEMQIDFTGTLAGDSMNGNSKQGTEDVPWSAFKLSEETPRQPK